MVLIHEKKKMGANILFVEEVGYPGIRVTRNVAYTCAPTRRRAPETKGETPTVSLLSPGVDTYGTNQLHRGK